MTLWNEAQPPPWRTYDALTPESLWEFIQRYERIMGKRPKLRECVDEFDGKKLCVTICLWALQERGLVGREDRT